MKPHKREKLGSLIQEKLSFILARDFDPCGALVTVVSVEISDDLLNARVKMGIIPYEKGPEIFIRLESIRRKLQHQLLKSLKTRLIPRLNFEIAEGE